MTIKRLLTYSFIFLALACISCQSNEEPGLTEAEIAAERKSRIPTLPTEVENPVAQQEVVSTVGPRECGILKESGRYDYVNFWDSTAFITIDDNILTEHYLSNEYFMEAGISWTSDCTYDAQVKRINIPFANLKPGDVMKVEILQTRGDTVFFMSTYGEDTNYVRMLKR